MNGTNVPKQPTIPPMPFAKLFLMDGFADSQKGEPMDDTISRQQAIDALNEYFVRIGKLKRRGLSEGEKAISLDVVGAIKGLPSAEPQIIRCKDCKHWIPYDWMFSEIWQSKNIADYPEDDIGCDCCDMAMKANDFCSRAERRENEP